MVDLQVIEIRDILRLTGVSYVQGSDPQTLLIQGQDFTHAQEVYVNEAKCPNVIISSSTALLAQVPETQVSAPIRTIVVVSGRLTRTDRSQIDFRIGDTPATVDGLTRLIQTFLKLMLQGPGTDIFAPKVGGGLLRSLGQSVSSPTSSTMVADFALAVNRARQQLLALQSNNTRLSMSERLLYANMVNAHFNPSELALTGQVAIGNQVGNGSVVGLGL